MAREVRPCPNTRRRAAIGLGGGFLFSFGPMLVVGALACGGAVQWPPTSRGLLLALPVFVGLLIAIPFFLSALSWLWSFRCPECGRQIRRLTRVPLQPGPGHALRYHCSACCVEWDLGWRRGTGDYIG